MFSKEVFDPLRFWLESVSVGLLYHDYIKQCCTFHSEVTLTTATHDKLDWKIICFVEH